MIACFTRLGESDYALLLGKRLADLDEVFPIVKDADAENARWISQTLQQQVRRNAEQPQHASR